MNTDDDSPSKIETSATDTESGQNNSTNDDEIPDSSDSQADDSSARACSLLPYKISFFSFFASRGVTSFLPLFLKHIGMNADQIGIILFFRPAGGIMAGIVCPFITRKFLNKRTAIVVYSALYLLFLSGISWIPVSPMSDTCPVQLMESLTNRTHYSDDGNNVHTYSPKNFTYDVAFNRYLYVSRQWMFQNDNLLLILLSICVLVFSGEYFGISTDTIQHAATLETLGSENYKSYGLIRAWGALGYGMATLTTGLVISTTIVTSKICGVTLTFEDYRLLFYTFACFAMVVCINTAYLFQELTIEHDKDKPSLTTSELKGYLFNMKDVSWLAVLVCRSAFVAVAQGFLFWHMENIGASPVLLGAASLVTTCTEFAMFFMTPWLLDKIGHAKIVSAGLLSYFVRFLLFSVISSPYYILPLEILEGVTFACVWSAAVSYVSGRIPGEGMTQIQGVINIMVWMGSGLGYIVSGFLTESYGATAMFLVFAAISLATFVAFVMAQAIGVKNIPSDSNIS